MQSDFVLKDHTIANGASLSDAKKIKGNTPVGLLIPTAWTAAVITFEASFDNSTFAPVYHLGVEYQLTGIPTADGAYVSIDPKAILGATSLKVRSGTKAAAVNQGAERVIQVVSRGW